jgi:hypothetical protein
MLNNNNALALSIKNIILTNFLHADIEIIFDKEQNEYFISTRNKELYYSEGYGMLMLEISKDILWKQGIFNFYFILDERNHEFDKMTKNLTFSLANEIIYKTWDVNKPSLFVGKHIDVDNYSLAA